jgi:hypothetical protein
LAAEEIIMTPAVILIVGGFVLSFVLAICGIVFLFKEKSVYDSAGKKIEIEVPLFGKLTTNFPAIGALVLATALAAFTLQIGFKQQPDRFPIHASVNVDGLDPSTATDVIVGIIPGSYMFVNTLGRGSKNGVSRRIYVAGGEHSYTGVAFKRGTGRTVLEIGSVTVEEGNHSFNAELRARP